MSFQVVFVLGLLAFPRGGFALDCRSGLMAPSGSHRCLLIVNDYKNWTDAKKDCCNRGYELARPLSQPVNEWLLRQTGQMDVWISANDRDEEGTWVWEDGSPIRQFFWAPGEPNNQVNNEHCGDVRGASQMWNDAPCRIHLPYSCEACFEGWIKGPNPSKCYHIEINDRKPWTEAKTVCNSLNATLAKPKSKEENVWLLQQTGQRHVWISANDLNAEHNWVWEDGSAIQPTLWNEGEPNNLYNEDCGLVGADSQMWNDAHCSTHFAYACEM